MRSGLLRRPIFQISLLTTVAALVATGTLAGAGPASAASQSELTFAAAGALAASGAASGVASYGFDVATGPVKNPSVGGVLKAAGFGAAGSVLTLGAGKFVGAALRRPAAALVSSDSALARVTGKTLQRLDVPIGGKSGAGKGDPVPSGPKQEPGTSATGGGDTSGTGGAPGGKRAPTSCALNSFAAGTLVRMADGTATPIEKIRTGDAVVSADPKTGRDVTGTVTAAYVNQDHQFTDLQFAAADGGTTSLHTTSHHRIWDQTTHTFANATDLQTGHQIHTTDGQTWKLTGKHSWHGSQRMYDITVGGVHTFYVLAGQVPILVHNCGDADDFEDFAHGTSTESGNNIVNNGLDADASVSNMYGSKAPGSFFTVPVNQADSSAALEIAANWGARHGGETCVVVCRLPSSVVSDLESEGLLSRTETPLQAVFHPGAFPAISLQAQWFGPIPVRR